MSQPTPYDRQTSFAFFSSENPDTPQNGTDLDAEFNAVKLSLDETQANLALIQDDDGRLKRGSVGRAQLDSSFTLGFSAPSQWAADTTYTADDSTVFHASVFYTCIETHTSTDSFDASKWEEVADFSGSLVIDDDSIDAGDKLVDESIPTDKYAPQSVTETVLGANSVSTSKVQDRAITPAKASGAADWAAFIIPAGTIIPYPTGASTPTGWVNVTAGATLSRTTYPSLWSVAQASIAAGETWFGVGDGSTTFTVANPKGRAFVGVDALAAVVSGATLAGATQGAKNVTLSSSEIPSHTHSFSATSSSNGDHKHTSANYLGSVRDDGDAGSPARIITSFASLGDYAANTPEFETGTTGAHTHTVSGTTGSAGSGSAHDNMQPSVAVHYLMKAH